MKALSNCAVFAATWHVCMGCEAEIFQENFKAKRIIFFALQDVTFSHFWVFF